MSNSPSPASAQGVDATPPRVALVACGAIAADAARIAADRGWRLDAHPLPPLLHNRPERIAPDVEARIGSLAADYAHVIVGYADCGTYGALDRLCARLGVRRLRGLHCYDMYAGPARIEELLRTQPGTYLLTDFLVRSFQRTVIQELGLDRYPELRDDYFRHYERIVWLAQAPDDELRALAERAARRLGLPLVTVETGCNGLEAELLVLLSDAGILQEWGNARPLVL